MNIYALIDAANTPDLFAIVKQYNPPITCLYNDPMTPDEAAVAPYLLELNCNETKEWLVRHSEPWGIYLISSAPFVEIRQHLRRFTYAKLPMYETPVTFRYYDPRTIWDFTEIIDDWTLHAFLGPIKAIVTFNEGVFRQEEFKERRNKYPKKISLGTSYITITDAQYARLDELNEQQYIKELSLDMQAVINPEIIEKAQNSADKIHQQMLEHERDVKGAEITNPVDQAFLLNQSSKAAERHGISLENLHTEAVKYSLNINPIVIKQAYYHFSHKTGHWTLIRGNHQERVIFVVEKALSKIGKTPMSQNEFHEHTQFEYVAVERAEYEKVEVQKRALSTPDPLNDDPYFIQQMGVWYYVNEERNAYRVNDERLGVLRNLYDEKIFEADFHKRTNNRFVVKTVPLEEDDAPFVPETMDELIDAINILAHDLYYFCQTEEITDSRSMRGIGILLVTKEIYRLNELPDRWVYILKNNGRPGDFRAERLVITQLGYMPA